MQFGTKSVAPKCSFPIFSQATQINAIAEVYAAGINSNILLAVCLKCLRNAVWPPKRVGCSGRCTETGNKLHILEPARLAKPFRKKTIPTAFIHSTSSKAIFLFRLRAGQLNWKIDSCGFGHKRGANIYSVVYEMFITNRLLLTEPCNRLPS